MTRYFKVVSPKHDGVYTGESPKAAAQKAGNAIIGDVKSGSEKKTVEIRERGTDKQYKYTVTKKRLSSPRKVEIEQEDGTTRTISFKYEMSAERL